MAAENLLCALLGCGECDLEILDRVGFDWEDVIEMVERDYEHIDGLGIEGLMKTVVRMALNEFGNDVLSRKSWLSSKEVVAPLTDDEKAEKEQTRNLSPWQDVRYRFNYRDTHVWFAQNEEVYRKYFPDEIRRFYENTGLNL